MDAPDEGLFPCRIDGCGEKVFPSVRRVPSLSTPPGDFAVLDRGDVFEAKIAREQDLLAFMGVAPGPGYGEINEPALIADGDRAGIRIILDFRNIEPA